MNKKDMFIREKLQQDKVISDKANRIFDNIKEEFEVENNEKKVIKIKLSTFIAIAASFVVILFLGVGLYSNILKGEKTIEPIKTNKTETKQAFKYALKSNSLEDFDLRFLQLENEKKNKIYSPLSIKYTLAMLNEGTEGESKEQISSLIGQYKANKYINSENMSFANALFIKDSYKGTVKENFVNNLRDKYNANVEYDSFNSADRMNSWISDKTLGLIDNMIDDSSVSQLNFALVNALAIDMEWEDKFLEHNYASTDYKHEKYGWSAPQNLLSNKFEGIENEISGMGIIASINNYDIVNTLGEENIRKTVGDEFRKYLNEEGHEWERSYYLEGKDVETAVKEYLDTYIEEINRNYKSVDKNTDFYIYENEEVKAFAKDLKEYNETKLQYVAIMPEEELDKYIDNITVEDVNKVINNLKALKSENFKEGVITQIVGYIPKFKFDYDLNLIQDLNDMGVKDVFNENKANLKGITDEQAYISEAMHKANIEFTQDGIKASAATFIGGAGAGDMFDYYYDVPVETIDLTFDKPYMFIIRDTETGEVWFAGTVYEPWSIEDEPEADKEFEGVGKYSDFLKRFEIIETEIQEIEEPEEDIDENQKEDVPTNKEETETINEANAMIEMLKYRNEEYRANYYYRLAGLKNNNNGTYTATVDFYSPIFYSEEQYNNIVNNRGGVVEGVSYTFSRQDIDYDIGYGYIYKDNVIYTIEKQNLGYAFYSELGGVIKTIDTKGTPFEMTLDEEFIVKNVLHGENLPLKECASTLNECLNKDGKITFEYSEEDNIYMLIDWR